MFENLGIGEAADEFARRACPLVGQSDFDSLEGIYAGLWMESQWANPKEMSKARQVMNNSLRSALRAPRVGIRHGIFDHITQSRFFKKE